MVAWRPKARALVKNLVQSGELRSPAWQDAFASVPRHVFVPSYWEFSSDRDFVDQADPERWLGGVYSNQVLITQTRPQMNDRDTLIPTSSSSMPAVMAHMLEILDVLDGDRVLEIGTGTGYMPTVRTGDGLSALPDVAPFDRIIATAAVDHVPSAWIEQLRLGGIIVAPVQGSISGGLVKLEKVSDDTVEGRFDAYPVAFMPMRPVLGNPQRHQPTEVIIDRMNPYRSTTTVDPKFVDEDDEFRFFLQLHFGATVTESLSVDDAGDLFVTAADGSWFVVNKDQTAEFRVSQAGPRRLWDTIEAAHELWWRLGAPNREQFGLTATAHGERQYVWLDAAKASYAWPLSSVRDTAY